MSEEKIPLNLSASEEKIPINLSASEEKIPLNLSATEEKLPSLTYNEKLDYIKNKYRQHINDRNCVYDLLLSDRLVIMRNVFETQKDENGQSVQCMVTRNNESRTGVFDQLYAVFRADRLQVCAIINVETLETEKVICDDDNYHDEDIAYCVGETVESDWFDSNPNNVYAGGLYYYKSIERAMLQRHGIVSGFTGNLIRWYDDGKKMAEETFVDGHREGVWPEWSPDGIKCIEENYLHGEKNGTWSCWYESEKIAWTKVYEDNGERYKFTAWYEDSGEKESEGIFIVNKGNQYDDKEDGPWTYWDIDGNKSEEYYVRGVKQNIKQFDLQKNKQLDSENNNLLSDKLTFVNLSLN